jgi:uncharacterized protein YdeI (YjbR/CyaY-like superfamily)
MKKQATELKEIFCNDRRALRKWLIKNHEQKESVWLIIHKKNSTTGTLSYNDAVEEGLCFGWIDSKPNKLDENTYKLLFSPRKVKSVWSKVNKAKIDQLLKDGLMQAAGLAKIEAAKKDGSWNILDAIEALQMPSALQSALQKNKKACQFFGTFPASIRKQIFWWIHSAKTEETRMKRVNETATLAAKNIRANQYIPKNR